jgi:hypothetical protein
MMVAELTARERTFLSFLAFFIFLCHTVSGQILSQEFDTLNSLAEFRNVDAPNQGQVNRINLDLSNSGTEIFSLGEEEGNKFLRVNKQGRQMRHFSRSSGIEQEPTLIIAFDFELISTTREGRIAAWFVGDELYPNSRAPERVEKWVEVGIYTDPEHNTFTVSNETEGTTFLSNKSYSGKRRITIVVNNSQELTFYDDPTGGSTLVPHEAIHIWVDEERQEISHQPYLGASAEQINEVKFMVWNTDFDAVFHIDNLVIGELGAVPLPVELLEFRAAQVEENVELRWETATEQNSSHFVIERGLDGKQFSSLGEQAAAGNSSSLQVYTFTDARAAEQFSGTVYYRLKIIDIDGTFEYSPVLQVAFSHRGLELVNVSPNPFHDHLRLRVRGQQEQLLNVELRDQQGALLFRRELERDSPNIRINTPEGLSPGMYLLKVSTAGQQRHFRVLKL